MNDPKRTLALNILITATAVLLIAGLSFASFFEVRSFGELKAKYPIFGSRKQNAAVSATDAPRTEAADAPSKASNGVIGNADIGHEFAIVLLSDGRAAASGNNAEGQCRVEEWSDLVEVAAGYTFSLGLRRDGTVLMAGRDPLVDRNEIESWSDITHISANASSVIAVDGSGGVHIAGGRTTGNAPEGIAYTMPEWVEARGGAVSCAAGKGHLAVLYSDGTVGAFGTDIFNCCAVDDWENVVMIAAGVNGTAGLTSDGRVLYTGTDNYGQQRFNDLSGISFIAFKGWHLVYIANDGTVGALGWDANDRCAAELLKKEGTRAVSVAASGWNSMAVFDDGSVSIIGHKNILGVIDASRFVGVMTGGR